MSRGPRERLHSLGFGMLGWAVGITHCVRGTICFRATRSKSSCRTAGLRRVRPPYPPLVVRGSDAGDEPWDEPRG